MPEHACANVARLPGNGLHCCDSGHRLHRHACRRTVTHYIAMLAQATEALRITSTELLNFKVMDDVIPEPLGGAHSDPMASFPAIKDSIMNVYHNKCASRL